MPNNTTAIKFYGTSWCYETRKSRRVFTELGVDYDYIDIDKDSDGRRFVESVNHGYRSVPTILFPDGSTLVEPSAQILREKLLPYQRN